MAPDGHTRSKHFQSSASWDDVLSVYVFDRKLRLLVMEAIERIEVAVRASWTNRLTLAWGSHAHLDPDLFVDPWNHAAMLAKMATIIGKSDEIFVKHYRTKYTHPFMPPLWAVCETLTLGELSLWFAATKDQTVRAIVAKDVGVPTKEVLDSVLQVLSLVRNICAHHNRLWNRVFIAVPKSPAAGDLPLVAPAIADKTSRNRLYAAAAISAHLMTIIAPRSAWRTRLLDLMATFPAGPGIVRASSGFPDRLRDLPLLQV